MSEYTCEVCGTLSYQCVHLRDEPCICRAKQHDYDPISEDGYAEGLRDGQAMATARVVKYLSDYGIPDPVTDSKGIPCEHGIYNWHICEPCAIEQITAFLEGCE